MDKEKAQEELEKLQNLRTTLRENKAAAKARFEGAKERRAKALEGLKKLGITDTKQIKPKLAEFEKEAAGLLVQIDEKTPDRYKEDSDVGGE